MQKPRSATSNKSGSDLLHGQDFMDTYSTYALNQKQAHDSRCSTGHKPIEVVDAESASMNPDVFDAPFEEAGEIVGTAKEIEQIPFASGSTSLGMEWIPAPMKFYSPLSHFSHEISIAQSPVPKVYSNSDHRKPILWRNLMMKNSLTKI